MLYDILALLWETPHDLDGLTAGVRDRTGSVPNPPELDGHLWYLFQFGFVEALEGRRAGQPVYALTPNGSQLLALAAEAREAATA